MAMFWGVPRMVKGLQDSRPSGKTAVFPIQYCNREDSDVNPTGKLSPFQP